MFKSRDATALPALDAALAKETDPKIKRGIDAGPRRRRHFPGRRLRTQTRSLRIDVIADRGDQDALALLGALKDAARPISSSRPRAHRPPSSAGWRMLNSVQNAWYGLSLGSVLLLAAIGLAITFGVMGIINMAHGEMVMLGAYTTFVVQEFIRTKYPGLFDWSLPIAIPLAFLVAGAVGIADRARHHPLPLWPPAGNAAGHLGRQSHPAADRAHPSSEQTTEKSARPPSWQAHSISTD